MTRPNFLIIGAGRAGTTSLHHYVGQHPDVFTSPIKETNYFAYRVAASSAASAGAAPPGSAEPETTFPVRSLGKYRKLFRGASGARAVGEASPRYMADPRVADEIAAVLPDVRIVAILRDPVERAYSSYLFHRRDGRETRSFDEAIRQEREGTADPGLRFGQRHYTSLGFYDRLLAPYFERFPRDRIGIFLFDDLRRDAEGLMRDLFRFLGVDPGFEPDLGVRYNASGVPRRGLARAAFRKRPWIVRARRSLPRPVRERMDRWIEALRSRRLESPPLPDDARRRLRALFAADLARLEERIARDLSGWL